MGIPVHERERDRERERERVREGDRQYREGRWRLLIVFVGFASAPT